MTGQGNLARQYREIDVKTATPLQLIVMLYDTAIISVEEALGHMDRKDIASRSRSINHCGSILTELQSCLDRKAGGEIAASLDRLYDYMKRILSQANAEQNPALLREAKGLLENLRSAWRQISVKTPMINRPSKHEDDTDIDFMGMYMPAENNLKSFSISA